VCRLPRILKFSEARNIQQFEFDEYEATLAEQERQAFLLAAAAMKILLLKMLKPKRVEGLGYWNVGVAEATCAATRSNSTRRSALGAACDNRVIPCANPDEGDVKLVGKIGNQAKLTHWAFGQLCNRAMASPAGYLRAFEGLELNVMYFAYFNRNYEEQLDIPLGPNNNMEPGGDRGQPTPFICAGTSSYSAPSCQKTGASSVESPGRSAFEGRRMLPRDGFSRIGKSTMKS